jgi:hypothetical protein
MSGVQNKKQNKQNKTKQVKRSKQVTRPRTTRGFRVRKPNSSFGGTVRPIAPSVSLMTQFGPSFIRSIGKNAVAAGADFGPEDGSERVEFSDTITQQVVAGSGTAAAGFGGTATYNLSIAPSALSPRLVQYEEMYQWYAIRELEITYCPLISTSTSVGYNLGISNNFSDSVQSLGTPTAQDINELSPSMSGPVYAPQTMCFRHTGKKLWSTSSDTGSNALEYIQFILQCFLDGTPVASTVYGKLRVVGVVDFYKQCPPFSTDPALVLKARIQMRSSPELAFAAYYREMTRLANLNPDWLLKAQAALLSITKCNCEALSGNVCGVNVRVHHSKSCVNQQDLGDEKLDSHSKSRSLVGPNIPDVDDDYEAVLPQVALISLSSAKRDVLRK